MHARPRTHLQVDPTGKRTIGVLTKPDLINPGGEAEVLEVLSNNRKPLKLGYVMVKVIYAENYGSITIAINCEFGVVVVTVVV